MHIKNYFIAILFSCIFLPVKATGLSGDLISLDGETWVLMAKPINKDPILFKCLMGFIPDNHCASTSNWEGYTAFWEIRDNYLCLRRMEVCVYDKANKKDSTLIYDAETLQIPFASYYKDEKIQARWFSGELRAGKGDLLRYVHSGFDRNMETEQVLHIKSGKVVKTTTYHNFKKPGLNMMKAQDEIIRRFPWKRFPEYKGLRITFLINNFQMTHDGHFANCEVPAIYLRPSRETIEDGNHPLAIAFKETLKAIYPWEILFINGKYTTEYTNFTIGIWEKDTVAHTTEKYSEVSAFD